jgi:hypothetical protein
MKMTATLPAEWIKLRNLLADYGIVPVEFHDGVLTFRCRRKDSHLTQREIVSRVVDALDKVNAESVFAGIRSFRVEMIDPSQP